MQLSRGFSIAFHTMPFTFSHPALIVPLLYKRRTYQWLSATGLITGSIAPDFEKFFTLQLSNDHSHTLASVLYFSYPVSLLLAFLFHLVVRQPLLTHLPEWLHVRLRKYAAFDWLRYFRGHYGGVLLSIGMGAILHLLWDSVTHYNALMLKLLPIFSSPEWLGYRAVRLFDALGLISSVFGAVVVAWAVWKMPTRLAGPMASSTARYRYWAIIAGVAIILEIEWLLVMNPRLLEAGISIISAFMLGILIASIYVRYHNRTTRQL